MPFEIKKLDIPDIVLVEVKALLDERGFFSELYTASECKAN